MSEIKICKICGAKFIPRNSKMFTCGSEECQRLRGNKSANEKHEKEKAQKVRKARKQAERKAKIVDIAVAARQEGMTYGQYVAMHGL